MRLSQAEIDRMPLDERIAIAAKLTREAVVLLCLSSLAGAMAAILACFL